MVSVLCFFRSTGSTLRSQKNVTDGAGNARQFASVPLNTRPRVCTGGQNKVKNNVLKNGICWLFYHPKVVLKCSSGIARQLTCTRLSALH